MHCLSSCWALPHKLESLSLSLSLSLTSPHQNAAIAASSFKPLGSSANLSVNIFSKGLENMRPVNCPPRRSIVCEAEAPGKKSDSASKRARQAEKRRLYNKAKKSEVKTRMKKVLEELEVLRKKADAEPTQVLSIEKLIAEAYSAIDKAVKTGTLHRNTGARRKSRLARNKKAVEIHHGWYTPSPVTAPDTDTAPTSTLAPVLSA